MILRALALTLLASPAMAFTASNDLAVRATGKDTFSVPYGGQSGPAAFWCAAGDYVVRDLRQGPQTRIYRTSPVPRKSGQGMAFSLTASASAGKSGLILLGSDDGGVSAVMAQTLCSVAEHLGPAF